MGEGRMEREYVQLILVQDLSIFNLFYTTSQWCWPHDFSQRKLHHDQHKLEGLIKICNFISISSYRCLNLMHQPKQSHTSTIALIWISVSWTISTFSAEHIRTILEGTPGVPLVNSSSWWIDLSYHYQSQPEYHQNDSNHFWIQPNSHPYK